MEWLLVTGGVVGIGELSHNGQSWSYLKKDENMLLLGKHELSGEGEWGIPGHRLGE